jgi:type II secretory pathway component PulK
MNLRPHIHDARGNHAKRGSVLVIVLMITIGMISISIYFANSMSLELRAADNRSSGLAAEQAIEGALRYVDSVLSSYGTNGVMPEVGEYVAEAVSLGTAITSEENPHFWFIGRNIGTLISTQPHFALVDEASKLDLNAPWLNADVLATNLPGMTYEFAEAIIDWRSTNGTSDSSLNYSQMGYLPKHAPFETVGELRLLYGATAEILAGEDINRNGILDANEEDWNGNGIADPGVMEYFTVYNREPGTRTDGSALTNVNESASLYGLLEARLGSSRAREVTNALAQAAGPGQQNQSLASLFQFYIRSRLSSDEFALVSDDLTVTNGITTGRVNVNTASAAVLACLPGLNLDTAQQLVSYREANAVDYRSFAWIVDALGGRDAPAVQALAQGDYITAKTYQVTADIAGLGPFGRGYRRSRFVVDTSEGTPKVIYRQDLSRLGWALGREARETWVTKNTR